MQKIFISLSFFIKSLFIKKELDFIFSYHQSLAPSDGKPPELIEPLLNFCKRNNYSYLIFEETDIDFNQKYNFSNKAVPLIFISLVESFLRRIFIFFSSEDLIQDWRHGINRGKLDQRVTKISSLFLRKINCKKIITLVSHKSNFWFYGFPNSEIFDLQHGIIFDGDLNYIKDGIPPKFKVNTNMKTLVHSDLIKNLLIENDSTNFYNDKNVKTIGRNLQYVKSKKLELEKLPGEKFLLFSAQNAMDCGAEEQEIYTKKISNFFKKITPILIKKNIKVLHRDHPRADFLKQLPYLDLDYIERSRRVSIFEDLEDSFCHMTFNSSSAIEAASIGVPTIFLELNNPTSGDFPDLAARDIYLNQYKYPIKSFFVTSEIEFEKAINNILENMQSLSMDALEWHDQLVEQISDDLIVRSLFF